jgi:hypothetical protein
MIRGSLIIYRNETLANEEQRAYIDILKQMLDDRFDKLALSQWITGLYDHINKANPF